MVTLARTGANPWILVEALRKMYASNRANGRSVNSDSYPSLSDCERFAVEMKKWLAGTGNSVSRP